MDAEDVPQQVNRLLLRMQHSSVASSELLLLVAVMDSFDDVFAMMQLAIKRLLR
jgi:hypothetical protein